MIFLFALPAEEHVDKWRTRKFLMLKCATATGKTILCQMLALLVYKWVQKKKKAATITITYATKTLCARDSAKMTIVANKCLGLSQKAEYFYAEKLTEAKHYAKDIFLGDECDEYTTNTTEAMTKFCVM
jgi:hypothetical protein